MLWRACKLQPKIQHYICDTLVPGMRDKSMDMLLYMGSNWIMASMNRVAAAERGSIIASLQKSKMVDDDSSNLYPAVGG